MVGADEPHFPSQQQALMHNWKCDDGFLDYAIQLKREPLDLWMQENVVVEAQQRQNSGPSLFANIVSLPNFASETSH